MDAATSDEVTKSLRGQGLYPTSIREQKAVKGKTEKVKIAKKKGKGMGFSMPGRVKTKIMTNFTRQLSTL